MTITIAVKGDVFTIVTANTVVYAKGPAAALRATIGVVAREIHAMAGSGWAELAATTIELSSKGREL